MNFTLKVPKIEPAADNNVAKVTANCLFMRTASGSMYGGRRSMSWWSCVGTVLTWVFFTSIQIQEYFHEITAGNFAGSLFEYVNYGWSHPLLISAGFLVCCFWMFIPWRRQLPIIFNRRTNKVTCFIDGHVISEDWSNLEAYIKDVTTFTAGGVPVNEGILTFTFKLRGDNAREFQQFRAVIMGTQDVPAAMINRGIYGAAMIWEYIRLYMREGAAAVPPIAPIAEYRLKRISDPFRHFNPLKVLSVKFWWYPIAIPFFIFIALPLAPVVIIGDLLYYGLDHILPRRKWPRELIDACEGIWDGSEN